ncbi:MAG TPA: cation-translocating P-type ATPase [Geobacteraceae bacterium]
MASMWHEKTVEEVMAELESSGSGLTDEEAAQRLARYGPNELPGPRRRSPVILFLSQFTDFMILVLIGAALVSGVMGETADTVVILVIVILNAVIGFIQEYRAERAMEALRGMAAPMATVVRAGVARTIPASLLVPGDVVRLAAGDIAPADIRLAVAAQVTMEEAALTGESLPTEKTTAPLPDAALPLGDRINICYKGTVCTRGRGEGVVVATGLATELGKIATLLGAQEEGTTPLQRRLAAFGRKLTVAILTVCAIVFFAGFFRGDDPLVIFLTAVSLAVAAIPEALPAVVTVSLALGARALVKANSLVKKLPAVETLGSVTYVCTDKTGTLTVNRMSVEEVVVVEPGKEELFFAAMALCNDAAVDGAGKPVGDPTEVALALRAAEHGQVRGELERDHPRVAELPFEAERKLMTTFHPWEGGFVSFTKGAPEVVLGRSGIEEPLAEEAARRHDRLADDGLRVMGFAMRRFEKLPLSLPEAEAGDLVFLGLAGMLDPPRSEAREAVRRCREAGITPVMITGDHPLTARAIARRLGILTDAGDGVVTGRELAAFAPEEFAARVRDIRVYARVAPEQKLRIVEALQNLGEFVAMTGDGVNDAPALKRADIGIAMGITGTDVAKEAAHLVLLDDNFATIVAAVAEGRRIYDNIRKFIRYLLTTNSGEVIAVACAPFVGLPVPLTPIQILWVNLMTDSLPALALSLEPAEGEVMARPPRPPRESIFAHGLGRHVVWVGLLIGALVLLVEGAWLRSSDRHWQTMAFTVLCFTQLFHVLAIRSERHSLFTIGLLSNRPLLGAVTLSALLQLAIIYLPPCNPLFGTVPLTAGELAAAIGISSLVFVAVEMEKFVQRRRQPVA